MKSYWERRRKDITKCPVCSSTKLTSSKRGTKCLKCGYINENER